MNSLRTLSYTLALLTIWCLNHGAARGEDLHDLFMAGHALSPQEAIELEVKIKLNPSDVDTRKILLGYYFGTQYQNEGDRKKRSEHILWLVENAPESAAFQSPETSINPQLDAQAHKAVKDKWQVVLRDAGERTGVIKSAVGWFSNSDFEQAAELAERGRELEPNEIYWPQKLARIYQHQAFWAGPKKRNELLKSAFKEFERAYELADPMRKSYLRQDIAKVAIAIGDTDSAKKYANQMLEDDQEDWNTGNNVHAGNCILGLAALKEDNVEEAKKRLLAAGATKGSPQLNSFGPNLTLAKALLKKGESKVVLEYLELCRKFWEMGGERLDTWTEDIENNRAPDFNANLNY